MVEVVGVTPLPFTFRKLTPSATPRVKRLLLQQRDAELARAWSGLLHTAGVSVKRVENSRDALSALDGFGPDAAVLDLVLPDGDGVELVREIARRDPQLPVVVVSAETDESRILAAIRAGASGYVFAQDMGERVVSVVEEALRGGAPLSRPVSRLLLHACRGPGDSTAPVPDLTRREQSVLGMLAEGKSYADVGTRLGVSENTVRSHVRSIYDKLGASSKTEAVMTALRLGLVRVR